MSGRRLDLDKVLDISSITGSRGFVVSSSDEEDNVVDLGRSSNEVGNRLANIFKVPIRKSPTSDAVDGQKSAVEGQKPTKSPTIFATSAILFAPDEAGKLEKKCPVGAAVLFINSECSLVVYNSSKQRLATFSLKPGALNVSTQCIHGCYLMISSVSSSVALFFSEGEREAMQTLTALIVILCELERCDLVLGSGETCGSGDHVLVDSVRIEIKEGQIEKTNSEGEKAKLSSKSPKYIQAMEGMARGGSRIVRESSSTAYILILRKKKNREQIVVPPSESEASSQVEAAVVEAELSDVEADVHQLEDRTNDVLSRIARLGRPVIPSLPSAESATVESETPLPATDAPPAVTNVPADYSTFHQVLGTEVDRLEIRLEAAVQRMIDRSLAPILQEVRSISATQEKLLEELRHLRNQ